MTASTNVRPIAIQIQCSIPFALYTEGEYEVTLPVGKAKFSIRRIRQEHLDKRLGIGGGNFDLKGDRWGLVSYSEFSIEMDWAIFEQLSAKVNGRNNIEILQSVISMIVNRVVDSYRHATEAPWIRRVARHEIFNPEAKIIRSDGIVEGIKSWTNAGRVVTLPVIGLADATQQTFEQNLNSSETFPVWEDLWLDSEDSADRGDTRAAIIWGHSALETLAHTTVLAWLRDQNLSVADAADKIGKTTDNKKRLKKFLSLEELLQHIDDARKVEFALFDVVRIDPSWGFDRYARFELLAADRNDILHSGTEVTPQEAQDHLEVIRAIRAELSRNTNVERIRGSKPRPASMVMADLLGRTPHAKLTQLLEELEATRDEVTIWSMGSHPLSRRRNSPGVSMETGRGQVRIFLPRRSRLQDLDWQLELTRLLMSRMLIGEGWPFAVTSERSAEGKLALGSINWTGYQEIANAITDAVLGGEIDRRLEQEGFAVEDRIVRIAKDINDYMRSKQFREPNWGDMNYFQLPIKIIMVRFARPELAEDLIEILREKTPSIANTIHGIVELIDKVGWQTPESCATVMLVLKRELGILDTIGVREAPEWGLRTRFKDDEINALKTGNPN